MDDIDKAQGQTQNQQQPQAGGGITPVKEQEPVNSTSQTESGVSEFVKPSETEPKIHEELEKMGVKSVSETPHLDEHAKKVGISHAGESVPVEPTGYAPVTMTEDVAKQTLKYAKPTDSIKWRAAIIVKFFKKMHTKLLARRN